MNNPKEFIVEIGGINPIQGGVILVGHNGEHPWHIGDAFGNGHIEKIEALGKNLKTLPPNTTAILTIKSAGFFFSIRPPEQHNELLSEEEDNSVGFYEEELRQFEAFIASTKEVDEYNTQYEIERLNFDE